MLRFEHFVPSKFVLRRAPQAEATLPPMICKSNYSFVCSSGRHADWCTPSIVLISDLKLNCLVLGYKTKVLTCIPGATILTLWPLEVKFRVLTFWIELDALIKTPLSSTSYCIVTCLCQRTQKSSDSLGTVKEPSLSMSLLAPPSPSLEKHANQFLSISPSVLLSCTSKGKLRQLRFRKAATLGLWRVICKITNWWMEGGIGHGSNDVEDQSRTKTKLRTQDWPSSGMKLDQRLWQPNKDSSTFWISRDLSYASTHTLVDNLG